MLYWLHEELEEGIRAQERHTVEALGVLLRRAAEGKHLLLCGRRVLTALGDWGKQAQLDFRSRGALEELGKRLKDAPPLLNAATVRVDVGPARWPRGWADHAKSVYQLPVTALDDMDAAAATTLLTEGQADANLFEQAARALFAHKDYSCPRYIQLCIRPGLGGGGQIGDELVRISRHGAPVLCVVDADVSAPGEAPREGQTAWKALAACVKLRSPAHVEVLAAREVENLRPLPLLLAAFSPVDRMLGAQWEGRQQEGAFFPDKRGRYEELKGSLPTGTTARCAGHLADLNSRDAAGLLFAGGDDTWASLARLVLDWGIGVRPVRLS